MRWYARALLLLLLLSLSSAMAPRKRPAAGSNGASKRKKGKTAAVSDDDHSAASESAAEAARDSLSFYTTGSDTLLSMYDEYVQLVQPGKVLLTRHYDDAGFLVTDAVFAVVNSLPHRDGLLVEATFCGSTDKAPSDIQNITAGSDHVLFLQRYPVTSSLVASRPGLQPVHEWKPGFLDSLDESWISSGHRAKVRDAFKANKIKKLKDVVQSVPTTKRTSAFKSRFAKGCADPFPPLLPTAHTLAEDSESDASGMPGSQALSRLKKILTGEVDSKVAVAADDKPSGASKEAIIESLKAKLAALRMQKEVARSSKSKSHKAKTGGKKQELTLLQRLTQSASSGKNSSANNLDDISAAISGVTTGDPSSGSHALLPAAKHAKSDSGSDEDVTFNSTKKKKKKRHKKKKRRRSSSSGSNSRSSSRSSDSQQLFQNAGASSHGLANKIVDTSARKPGRLLKSTLQSMVHQLNPLAPNLESSRPAIVYQYLQRALVPSVKLSGNCQRELATIALASDLVLKGNLEGALEVLLQRFKSIESLNNGTLPPEAARNLEVIPKLEITSLSLDERNEAIALQRKWDKLGHNRSRSSPSPGRQHY